MEMTQSEMTSKGPIAWMAGNSVASNILMLLLLVGGIFIALQIRQEVFPAFTIDQVNVTVAYSGASPEEVEKSIILVIEQAVQGLDGVDEVNSVASEGSGVVNIDVVDGTDLQQFYADVKNEVDAITTFPDEAEEPKVVIATRRREVISYAIFGDVGERALSAQAEEIRDLLLQHEGITQVDLDGVRDYEIHVDVPMENIRKYGLTHGQIATRIQNAAIDLPGGSIKTRNGEILIRMKDAKDYAREYMDTPILTESDGARVRLRDIATIREGFSDSDTYAMFNGKRAIMIDVYRIGYQKPIDVANAVKSFMVDYEVQLPNGIEIAMVKDRSAIFAQRAELMVRNGYIGLALVFVCLALFLEIRLAFWVSLGIPISFFGSFLLLSTTDISINIISMFAYIISLGIVVDDAIVIGEAIYAHRKAGKSFFEAAVEGSRRVAMPVVFAVLTNIVAFMPLMFVEGIMGRIFFQIPVVVITVFGISLVESLFILPSHLSHGNDSPPGGLFGYIYIGQQWFGRKFKSAVIRFYGPFLKFTCHFRYIVIAVGVALLLSTLGYVQSGRMGFTLFPAVESDYAYCSFELPVGSSSEKMDSVLQQLVKSAEKTVSENGGNKLSKGVFSWVKENSASVRIFLTAPDIRPVSTAEVTRKWRQNTAEIPGLENISFEADRGGPGGGKGLSIELSHRDNDILNKAAVELATQVERYEQVKDVDDGSASGKLQFDFKMKKEGERMGFSALSVARQIRNAYYGAESLSLQRGQNEVTVMVRLPENERRSLYAFNNLIIRTDSGKEALLGEVVDIKRGRAYTTINRRAGRRAIEVTASVTPRSAMNLVLANAQTDILPSLIKKYPGLTYQFEGRRAAMQESVKSLIVGLLISLLVIYAVLAIPFRSFLQPVIIMVAIPFGMVGVVWGHLLLGYSISVMSLFGFVALAGVVVNDSLVMIDSINHHRLQGYSPDLAVVEAGIGRFRPIMLTTLTTFSGLAPMIFETSRQAKFMIPMAISLGFGILFATLITLSLVPSLYLVTEDIRKLFKHTSHFEKEAQKK